MKKNGVYIAAAILLILACTNPSVKEFHKYVIRMHEQEQVSKANDYFVFSMYRDADHRYIAGDFYKL